MALQILEIRRRPQFSAALIVIGLALFYRGVRHGPVHHEFTTQRSGEPRRIWRSMRTVWTFPPATQDGFGGIEELISRPNCLYYVNTDEIGCVEKSTGRLIWQRHLPPPQTDSDGSCAQSWHLAADSRLVYACGCAVNRSQSTAPYRVYALNAQTGTLVWQRDYTTGLLCAPCPADSLVLLTDVFGKVTAVRQSDGSTAWQRSITVTNFVTKNALTMKLQAAGGVGVAQVGGRLLGFRLSDGQQIWERRCKGETALQAEGHDSGGFALKDGIVYALLENSDLVAIQAATDRLVWTRQTTGGSPAGPVWLQGDYVFTCPFNFTQPEYPLVALRRSNGATVWLAGKDPPPPDREQGGWPFQILPGNRYTLYPGDTPHTLFQVAACEPVIAGVQRKLRSIETLGTVIARDPATGREQWRWQPDKGTQIDNLIPDGDRLIVSDGSRLFAFEDGIPDPLPTDPRDRQHLIHRMMSDTFEWRIDTPTARDRTDWTEAQLTLLRLGHDSVSPMLDYVGHKVDEANAQSAGPAGLPVNDNSLDSALDLLFDLDDPATPPLLAHELDRSKHPGFRKSLAETLIRWDDACAVPALFRYVKSGSEESDAREESLYFVCHYVDAQIAAGYTVSPSRAEITSFLLARLTDPKAPDWLRGFARFGLLNDRGEAAYRAAFATVKQGRTACLLPKNLTLKAVAMLDGNELGKGFPTEFHPESICQDVAGTWWAAFFCDYLGTSPLDWRSDLWIVQSRDKKHWIRPAFAFNLRRQCAADVSPNHIELTYRQGRLCLDWTEEAWIPDTQKQRKTRRHNAVTLADLYRDSDHDGLPDRFEAEIGTDPHSPDTNGNGIPDNKDKNPTYRPHALTEEEAIYQAVIEGLCRYGRWLSTTANYPRYWPDSLLLYGTSAKPLVLPAPPGSTGVEILEHPGPVLFMPYNAEKFYTAGFSDSSWFQHPFIGLDGRWQGRQAMPWESASMPPTDPFAPQSVAGGNVRSHQTFRDYFPYALSADHKRARVGWEMNEAWEGSAAYDIEVDKIGGQWLPIEFRCVYGASSHGSSHTAVPVAR